MSNAHSNLFLFFNLTRVFGLITYKLGTYISYVIVLQYFVNVFWILYFFFLGIRAIKTTEESSPFNVSFVLNYSYLFRF